jgi:uncharacterized protein with ParB-like and HNH nuclease domain
MSKTKPRLLKELLRQCGEGEVHLPDFQPSWAWAEDRVQSLIASISRAVRIRALMTLESRHSGSEIAAHRFALLRAGNRYPGELLLDGEQRTTSLHQQRLRRAVVETIPK